MKKRILAIFISAVLVVGAITGCGQKEEKVEPTASSTVANSSVAAESTVVKKDVKITFLNGSVEMVDWYNNFCDKFNKENGQGITVAHEFQKEAGNIIKIKFASGDVPDVTNQGPQEFIDQGMYLDLTNEKWWSRIDPAVKQLEADVKTGKNFRLDTNLMVAGIFYNKKIFSELGLKPAENWNDFYALMKTVKEKKPEVVPYYLGGKDVWILGHTLDFIANAATKQKLGPIESYNAFHNNIENELNFDAPNGGMATWGDCLITMKKEGLLNKNVITATYDNQIEAIVTGKAAMITQGMWAYAEMEKKDPNAKESIGFTFLPSIVEGSKASVLSGTDSSYLITSGSKYQAEGKVFLDALFAADVQKDYSVTRKAPSVFTDAPADWSPLKGDVDVALTTAAKINWDDKPMGYNGDEQGRTVQELLAGKYATGLDFAKAFKNNFANAWKASNNNK